MQYIWGKFRAIFDTQNKGNFCIGLHSRGSFLYMRGRFCILVSDFAYQGQFLHNIVSFCIVEVVYACQGQFLHITGSFCIVGIVSAQQEQLCILGVVLAYQGQYLHCRGRFCHMNLNKREYSERSEVRIVTCCLRSLVFAVTQVAMIDTFISYVVVHSQFIKNQYKLLFIKICLFLYWNIEQGFLVLE